MKTASCRYFTVYGERGKEDHAVIAMIARAFVGENPYVVWGTVCNAVFYFLFLAALSWTKITVALPLTAIEYGFAAVLAMALLKEQVPPLRWAGIGLVMIGIVLITRGGGET